MANSDNTAMVHLRMNKELLDNVKKLAQRMGVPLSLVGETLFKDFLNTKRLIIDDSYIPNEILAKILDESEKNRDNEKYWTTHNSVDDLIVDWQS